MINDNYEINKCTPGTLVVCAEDAVVYDDPHLNVPCNFLKKGTICIVLALSGGMNHDTPLISNLDSVLGYVWDIRLMNVDRCLITAMKNRTTVMDEDGNLTVIE